VKSTYKLLGSIWDHKALPKAIPDFLPKEEVPEWRKERNLFDLQIYRRGVAISELFKIECMHELTQITNSLQYCDAVIIIADYEPKENIEIALQFYVLRLLQIYEMIKQLLPHIPVSIMASPRIQAKCVDLLNIKYHL